MVKSKAARSGGRKFFSGVVVLTAATFVVKAIGAFFKIPMLGLVGIEGMGYFNAAYHVFGLLLTVSTAGLPVALSILVSRNAAEGKFLSCRRDYRTALSLFGVIGAVCSLVLYVFAEPIASFMALPRAALALRTVAPTILLATVTGSVRGYFQGFEIMYPTALSEVIEAVGKLFLGLGFAKWGIEVGRAPYEVAALAILGITAGEFAAMLYLVISEMLFERRLSASSEGEKLTQRREVALRLLAIALPVTLSSAVLSLTSLFDTLIIPSSLILAGKTEQEALNLYSTYTSLCLPMFGFPTAFITPLSMALVPAVASAAKRGDRETEGRVVSSALRLTGIFALPCTFGMAVLARPILETVYGSAEGAVDVAAPLLAILSASVFFSGLMTVSNSMLQSYGKEMLPIISLATGAAVKVASELILVRIPQVGIYGAPISTFLCSTAVMAVNFYFLGRTLSVSLKPLKIFLPAVFSSALAGLFAIAAYRILGDLLGVRLGTLLSILLTALFYAVFVLKSGALPKEEILMFPFGEKLCGFLKKIRLI